MATTAFVFGLGIKAQFSTTAADRSDWVTDTQKVALTSSAYTPDQDVHDYFNDVTNEVSGTNYTAGGATLGSKTLTYDSATNKIVLDAADAAWASATISGIRKAVVYKDTGVAATSKLWCWHDFGADQSVAAGTFTIQWDADGVFRAVVS